VVKAYDAALNYSSNSNQANATIVASTDTQAPTTPTALSAAASGTQITLSWLASTDNVAVSRYSIERSLSASSGFQELNTSTNTSYVDTGLVSNTTYYYRLRAQDTSANYSNYTNVINTTTGAVDTQSPTTPTSLSNSVSGTQVSLSWSASTDATGVTGYNILRSTTNGSGYSLLTTSATNSYTNTNLANNTYYYVVQAYDGFGNTSSNSNQTTAVINVDSPPTTPNVLSIYANGNQISLTWTPSTDNVVSYSVERSLSPLSGFGVVATVNNTSYTNNNLNNSTTYYYRVRALDAFSAYSNYSSVVNATTDGV
jgi:fibronectin type 3 domain-containing protein